MFFSSFFGFFSSFFVGRDKKLILEVILRREGAFSTTQGTFLIGAGKTNGEMASSCFSGTLDGILREDNVQFNILHPQVCVECSLCILRVRKCTPNQVVLAVFPHGRRNRDSAVLKACSKLGFTDIRWKVRNQNSARWIHRTCLHRSRWSVLLCDRLVLVNGLVVVVVDRHGLVSGHRLSRHCRCHGSLTGNSTLRSGPPLV